MKKIIFLLLILIPSSAFALDISSSNYILYNLNDDQILMQNGEKDEVYIASLTKIATAIVAIENIDNIYDTVTIPSEGLDGLIEANASVAGFRLGQTVSYKDLLYGLMMPSGADAAQTLAYYIAGGNDEFVKLMNDLANELDLKNTNFTNTTGLHDENHYSSVYDTSIILKYALENEIFYDLFTSESHLTYDRSITFRPSYISIISSNNLTNNYIIGGKTGFTTPSGNCFASIAKNGDFNYLLVTTGAPKTTEPTHIIDHINIYEYVKENYEYIYIYNTGDVLDYIEVVDSTKFQYNIIADESYQLYIDKNMNKDDISYNYVGLNPISPSNEEGIIGEIELIYNNKVINTIDVTYDGSLNYSIEGFIKNYYREILIGFVSFIGLIIIIRKLTKKKKRN